ncbi:MAG: pyridoxamine 5'-phosphate oxidase family protein [Hyphomicrobiales bacterium]|nr:pyridoxamine 5'-phosphate oxidase family protein [Hyphomicrobiales bacterium]
MSSHVPPPYYNDLTAALGFAMGQMTAAVADRRSPFHTPCVATIGLDGAPALRTVVLRGFESGSRTLRFHTDVRSRKWTELRAEARVSVHGYDAGRKLQLRFRGAADLHSQDAIAEAAWAASRAMSRMCYAQAVAPGAAVETPDDAARDPLLDDAAFANFAVVVVRFTDMEWLYLAARGHRRAAFAWDEAGALQARWLGP